MELNPHIPKPDPPKEEEKEEKKEEAVEEKKEAADDKKEEDKEKVPNLGINLCYWNWKQKKLLVI